MSKVRIEMKEGLAGSKGIPIFLVDPISSCPDICRGAACIAAACAPTTPCGGTGSVGKNGHGVPVLSSIRWFEWTRALFFQRVVCGGAGLPQTCWQGRRRTRSGSIHTMPKQRRKAEGHQMLRFARCYDSTLVVWTPTSGISCPVWPSSNYCTYTPIE